MADPTTVVRDYLEAWNRRDWDAFRAAMHPSYTYAGGDGKVQSGPDAGMAVGRGYAEAFPDGHVTIQRAYSCGDVALVEFIATGTHKGPLMGIPPTGKVLSLPVANICEIRDGKIVAEREYMDMLHMLTQLGVVKDPTGAAV